MFWINTDYLPFSALFGFGRQISALSTSSRQSLTTICLRQYSELAEFQHVSQHCECENIDGMVPTILFAKPFDGVMTIRLGIGTENAADLQSPVTRQHKTSSPSRMRVTRSSWTGCRPSFYLGMTFLTIILSTLRPPGSCHQGCRTNVTLGRARRVEGGRADVATRRDKRGIVVTQFSRSENYIIRF